MGQQDGIALLTSFVYVFAIIGIAEGLRRWRGFSVDFTRKFVHIGVGMWAYGTVLLFESREWALVPPLAFVLINTLSYLQGTFKAMETGVKGNLGTIYFPVSFAILVWLLWDRPHVLVASLMPMTWGDALAAIIGQRFGQHRFTVLGSTRSTEGSVVMFAASWVTTLVPLLLWPSQPLFVAVAIAGVTAINATVIEAVSPWGIDNLTVPALSALMLALMVV